MKLLEYQAKELFLKSGIPANTGAVISTKKGVESAIATAGLRYPVVIKAQVQVGGRGKAGGIRFAANGREAQEIADRLLFTDLKGHRVNELLVAEKAEIETEWYLSIILDRDSKAPLVIFSAAGGVDIEETAKSNPDKICKVLINPLTGITDYLVRYICSRSGVGMDHFLQLKDMICKLYRCFFNYHCMVVEINPLSLQKDGTLLAIDGKVEIDDAALYKLPDVAAWRDGLPEHPLETEARGLNFLYIPIEEDGKTAVMSNGSGMLMSMIDRLSKKSVVVGSALDLGGGATAERIKEAVRIVLSDKHIETLFICIFGGITRCDEVAGGIKRALSEIQRKVSVVVRMEGTNKQRGLDILSTVDGVTPVLGIAEGADLISGEAGRI